MHVKMISCCSESKTKTWMLARYAISLDRNLVKASSLQKRRKKVYKKVLRHFSLIPRLQRLYAV